MMRTGILVLATLALGAAVFAADEAERRAAAPQAPETVWGKETDGWQLGIAVAKTRFLIGEPILVAVISRNLSGTMRQAGLYPGLVPTWNVEAVFLPGEEDTPYTRFGAWLNGQHEIPGRGRHGSQVTNRVGAGESVTDIVCVNEVRDMTVPGKYSVTIGRQLWAEGQAMVTVEAPPVDVEVGGGSWFAESALPQKISLVADPSGRVPAAKELGRFIGTLIASLADTAQKGPSQNLMGTGRYQLEMLRADINARLTALTDVIVAGQRWEESQTIGRSATASVDQLGAIAQAHPDSNAGKTARAELEKLRQRIEVLLSEEARPARPVGEQPTPEELDKFRRQLEDKVRNEQPAPRGTP